MIFAALGPVSFQVIASPTKMERSKKYRWETIYVIGAPPIRQWIYDDVGHIDLAIVLHQMWCDPEASLNALAQIAELHAYQPLVFGNGQNLGNFVIDEISDKVTWQADDGTLICTEVQLALTEYPNATAPVVNYPENYSVGNPPGLTTSQSASPGSTLVISPSTAAPSGIPAQTPYTDIPVSTIAREAP